MRASLLALVCAMSLAAADYMYRPPPHLMPHLHGPPHGLHGPHGPMKHHPFASGKAPGGGPGKLGPLGPPGRHPPPHFHSRPHGGPGGPHGGPHPAHSAHPAHGPHHRPRKPPPSATLAAASPWKTSPYKTTKDPFRPHGSDADFGNQAAVLSAIKAGGTLTSSPLSALVSRPTAAAPAAPALLTYTNVVSDDRGPIHTIPAPNLSLADRPSHIADAIEHQAQQSALQHAAQQQAQAAHAAHAAHLQRQAIQSALSQLAAASAARPAASTTAAPLLLHHTQGYQVSEPQTASQEGVPQLYAPDPDPSRPAPKVKLTTDPHSLPSEGRGPHFSIDPQFGAVSSQPAGGYVAQTGPSLSPQDLFHLLNGFPLQANPGLQPLQQDVQPHVHVMHHGLTGDTLTAEHQHLMLQQQQQHLHHLQHQLPLHQLQPLNFQPQFQSFDFDEQSYQKSLFQGHQDHEVSEDAPRPSVQRPDSVVAEDPSPSASTASLLTAGPTSSTPARGDIRALEDADDSADEDEYMDAGARPWPSSTTQSQAAVTPGPQSAASPDGQDDAEDEDAESQAEAAEAQAAIREDADTYAADPSLVTPFRRMPNSVHVPEGKPGRLPYGARIRPKRIAVE